MQIRSGKRCGTSLEHALDRAVSCACDDVYSRLRRAHNSRKKSVVHHSRRIHRANKQKNRKKKRHCNRKTRSQMQVKTRKQAPKEQSELTIRDRRRKIRPAPPPTSPAGLAGPRSQSPASQLARWTAKWRPLAPVNHDVEDGAGQSRARGGEAWKLGGWCAGAARARLADRVFLCFLWVSFSRWTNLVPRILLLTGYDSLRDPRSPNRYPDSREVRAPTPTRRNTHVLRPPYPTLPYPPPPERTPGRAPPPHALGELGAPPAFRFPICLARLSSLRRSAARPCLTHGRKRYGTENHISPLPKP
jgi:hypothetical protein